MSPVSLLRADDAAQAEHWRTLVDALPRKDATLLPEFAQVFQEYGDGEAECFVFESSEGRVIYPHIRRALSALTLDHGLDGRFDVVTPYGYGGFVPLVADGGDRTSLEAGFRTAFDAYAQEAGIVSEFVRFHPYLDNRPRDVSIMQRIFLHCENVVMDLTKSEDDIFRQSRRRYQDYIRKAKRLGLTLFLDEDHRHIDRFIELYRESMARLGQTGYLDFDPSFFRILTKQLGDKLRLFFVRDGERLVAGALFLEVDDYMDYYLGASQTSALAMYPNHFLFHHIALWGKARGVRTLHLGGGRDTLVFFKQGFSRESIHYYIGQHIHRPEDYDALIEARRAVDPSLDRYEGYFPLYRAGLE